MEEIQEKFEESNCSGSIEVKGLMCPLPLFRTKKKLAEISSGKILKISGIDKDFLKDILVWCERNNHNVIDKKEISGYLTIFIKKG